MPPKKPIYGTMSLAMPTTGVLLFCQLCRLNVGLMLSVPVMLGAMVIGFGFGIVGLWRGEFFRPLPILGLIMNLLGAYFVCRILL